MGIGYVGLRGCLFCECGLGVSFVGFGYFGWGLCVLLGGCFAFVCWCDGDGCVVWFDAVAVSLQVVGLFRCLYVGFGFAFLALLDCCLCSLAQFNSVDIVVSWCECVSFCSMIWLLLWVCFVDALYG